MTLFLQKDHFRVKPSHSRWCGMGNLAQDYHRSAAAPSKPVRWRESHSASDAELGGTTPSQVQRDLEGFVFFELDDLGDVARVQESLEFGLGRAGNRYADDSIGAGFDVLDHESAVGGHLSIARQETDKCLDIFKGGFFDADLARQHGDMSLLSRSQASHRARNGRHWPEVDVLPQTLAGLEFEGDRLAALLPSAADGDLEDGRAGGEVLEAVESVRFYIDPGALLSAAGGNGQCNRGLRRGNAFDRHHAFHTCILARELEIRPGHAVIGNNYRALRSHVLAAGARLAPQADDYRALSGGQPLEGVVAARIGHGVLVPVPDNE